MRLTNTIKVLSAIFLLTAVVLGASIYFAHYLSGSAAHFENSIIEIENTAKSGDWNAAQNQMRNVMGDWGKMRKVWAAGTDHQEIDDISTAIFKMESYIHSEDLASALAESASLRQYIRHIPEKESMNLGNLF